MAVFLLADVARDSLFAFLKTNLPTFITAQNAARTGKNPLVPIQTWAQAPRVTAPELPALFVLVLKTGFRGAQWGVELRQTHTVQVTIQTTHPDLELLEQDLIGYGAALVNLLTQTLIAGSGYTLTGGVQLESFNQPTGADALDAVAYSTNQPEPSQKYFGAVDVPVTLLNQERP